MQLSDLTNAFETGDFARPNLFEVEIPYLGRNLSFKCRAAPMPPGNVEKIPVGYMNRKLNVAGDRTFEDWTVTIFLDEKHVTRQDVLDWQALAHGQGDTIEGATPGEYKKTATIRQFSRDGETITKEHTMYGVWPTVVGPVEMSWETNNEVSTFDVTFAMDWWI